MPRIPQLSELSIEQRIGQVLCFGWQGESDAESRRVIPHARELVETMQVGGVVLLGRNVDSANPLRTRAVLDELQAMSRVPLFLAIDQEGGSVNRFRAPFHEFPGNMAIGAIATGEAGVAAGELYARRQAEAQARELLAAGINWNFAPVVDVNNNPDNPIIGVRSYGEDPQLVARLGAAAIRGYQEAGLLACAKHFPGHGDTSVDSHLALPTINGDRARLASVELVPFDRAILEGVGAIMTTHILFPALDPARPATLSQPILTGLLRRELGYDGLVITDCLEMDAIASTFGTARGAVEALKAGADMVLVCHTLETQRETVEAIRSAVESCELPESRLNEAVECVLAAKRRFLSSPSVVEREPWRDPAIDSLEREIAEASITVVRATTGPLAVIPVRRNARILAVSMHPAVDSFAESVRRQSRGRATVDRLHLAEYTNEDLDLENIESYDSIVALTCPHEPWSVSPIDPRRQARLVRILAAAAEGNLIVVAIREPYDIREFNSVPTYICTYGYRRSSLVALAALLFGDIRATARLPVTVEGASA